MKFYDHLVEAESLIVELDSLDLTSEQKIHLTSLIDSSLHSTILDAILSELSNQDKVAFIKHLEEDDQEKIWKFLNSKVENIENKIKKTSEDLKYHLHEDLKKSKGKK